MSICVVCVCVYMCRIELNYVFCGCVCEEMCSVILYSAGVVCNVGLLRCRVSVQKFIYASIVEYVCLYVVELYV